MSDAPTTGRARIAVVADDLIWATRLRDGVAARAREPVGVRSASALVGDAPARSPAASWT